MISTNEPQVWAMVIGTLAAFFTLVGLVSTCFTRLMTARFDAMEATIDAGSRRSTPGSRP